MRPSSSQRHPATQLAIDIAAIVFGILFVVVTAVSIPVAVGMLVFGSY
jgi:hypothetical protein